MKKIVFIILILPYFLLAQEEKAIKTMEIDNTIFKRDSYWRGADGGATVELSSGKILWLFSDTFIDQGGTGKRSNARKMISNSIGIQDSTSLESGLRYYYKGTRHKPKDFFKLPGKNWFWTGQGIVIKDKLVIFLMEETANKGIGFEAIGWYVAIIDNPSDNPDTWKIKYFKGPGTFGVILGSSAVLQDDTYAYVFGVKEPATHETYLLRLLKEKLISGDLSGLEWWTNNTWSANVHEEPKSSSLFMGQTEFSVHYDTALKKYIQIQTHGFGKASIGYRLADRLSGPWSEPVLFYTPSLKDDQEYVYTAKAHPEYKSEELIVTYNINNFDFERLVLNEEIYFPKIIKIRFEKNK